METSSQQALHDFSNTLKKYAFKSSEEFRNNIVQHNEMTYKVSYSGTRPDYAKNNFADFDNRIIEMNFMAQRLAPADQTATEPLYEFAASSTDSQQVHPALLTFSPQTWTEVYNDIMQDELQEVDFDVTKHQGLIKRLTADNVECGQYLTADYEFSTDPAVPYIKTIHTAGHYIDGLDYDTVSSPVPEARQLPEQYDGDSDILDQFNEITAELRDEREELGDFLPFDQKRKEMLFIVAAVVKRRIRLRNGKLQ